MKLKFRLDPALKNAFLNLGTYLKKSIFLKYLIVKPFSFLFKNFRRFYNFFSFIFNSRIYKVVRFGLKIFAIFNIILGFGVILSYNDLNLQEPIVVISIIYAKILDFLNFNLFDFFRNKITFILRKAVDKIEPVEVSYPNTNHSSRWDSKPKSVLLDKNGEFRSLRHEYLKYKFIEDSNPWYFNPYFYVPVFCIISGVTIYIFNDSISLYWDKCTTYLVTSGIWSWFTGNNNNLPRDPDLPDLPSVISTLPVSNTGPYMTPDYVSGNVKGMKKYFRNIQPSELPLPISPEAGPSRLHVETSAVETAIGKADWHAASHGAGTPK